MGFPPLAQQIWNAAKSKQIDQFINLRTSMRSLTRKGILLVSLAQTLISAGAFLLSSPHGRLESSLGSSIKDTIRFLDTLEQNAMEDADLAGVLEYHAAKHQAYMAKEASRHESLLSEIQHSVEMDPYLTDTVIGKPSLRLNKEYLETEAHRHDFLLNEIAHSIDTGPYLTP